MRKHLLVWILCLCALPVGTACAGEALPEGMRVMADGSYPMHCAPLADGGFLLSGLCGEPMAGSIEGHFANAQKLPEEALAGERPLSGYVAAYDMDGTRRWLYRLPPAAPYQAIFAHPLADGRVMCRVMGYARYDYDFVDWGAEVADAFLLDRDGQYLMRLPWLAELSAQGTGAVLKWVHPAPEGVLAIAPVEDYDQPYLPVMTLYGADGQARWQASHGALADYYIYLLVPVEDGYVGYAPHRSSQGVPVAEPVRKCLFKLDAQGRLLWQREYVDTSDLSSLTVRRDGSMVGGMTRYQATEGGAGHKYTSSLRFFDANGGHLEDVELGAYRESEINTIFEAADETLYITGWRRDPQTRGVPAASYNMVLHAASGGAPLRHARLFGQAGRRTFMDVVMEGADGLHVVGTMPPRDGADRWYILPLDNPAAWAGDAQAAGE